MACEQQACDGAASRAFLFHDLKAGQILTLIGYLREADLFANTFLPATLPNLTKGNPTWQWEKIRRKRTTFPLAHPPFRSVARECCCFVTERCGKVILQGRKN